MKRNADTMVFALVAVVLFSGGCVMSEKYEAEKGRALNFQRLLAQEEKRTGELDSDLKRIKRENAELEARNRELSAQLQAVREQLGRVQEETTALREAAALREQQDRARGTRGKRSEKSAPGAGQRNAGGPGKMSPNGPGESSTGSMDSAGAASAGAASPGAASPMELKPESSAPRYHEVKPGETLFRLSRQYGVNVETLRHWNHLQDDVIEVGQKLVIGYE